MTTTNLNIETKIFLTILLSIASYFLFMAYPVYGLFFCCLSTFVLCRLYINLRSFLKTSITIILVLSTYILLVSEATQLQGQKLVCELIDYYAEKKSLPENLKKTSKLMFNSFTPTFSEYQYNRTFDSTSNYLFHIKYKDLWGNEFKYCDKCGEFECKMPSY